MAQDTILIGIDIGTNSSKGVACRTSGEVLAEAQTQHSPSVPRPGFMEHDADGIWWQEFCVISRQLVAGLPRRSRIGAVSVSALAPCLLPVDHDGKPLRPAILYRVDSRASEQIRTLTMRYGAQKLRQLSSSPLTSQSLGPKIMWLRDNEPEVFARTKRYLTANGYIVYKLTGTFVVDHHQASYFTPFINARRGCWDLRFADGIVDESQLPDIVWSSEVVGEITKAASDACGLPAGTPVTAGSADGLLEGLSAGVIQPGTAVINYASTMNIVLVTDRLAVTDRFWSSRGIFPGTFVVSGGVATAGSITSWFRRELARELTQETVGDVADAHGTLVAEAEQSPVGSNGLLMLPYFSGEDTPFHDPNARGVVAGLNLATTRGDLYRATLEGTALGIYDNLIQMRSAGFEINKLRALGGGVRSRLWPQIVSDMTGLTQELPVRTTGAPYGSAFLAGLAAGLLSVEDLEERWVRISGQIEPHVDHGDHYDRLYKQYKRLYRDTSEIVHELAVPTARIRAIGG